MDVTFGTTFNDYVALMSVNSPHALVMDWWRRLDLTLHEYAAAHGQVVPSRRRRPIEEVVPLNDSALTTCIRGLRRRRNHVAHESVYNLSSEDAAAYARDSFSVIGALGRRISHLENFRLALWYLE